MIKLLMGGCFMVAPSAFGLISLLFTIAVPVSFVLLLIWIYQLKKNSEKQIEQNKEIIRLLEKEKA
jgi:predicted membrane protein